VEEGDDDRERVISGWLENVQISQDHDYDEVMVDGHYQSFRYMVQPNYYLERTRFLPDENGNYLKLETWDDEGEDLSYSEEDDE
jgi:hypothetical protein